MRLKTISTLGFFSLLFVIMLLVYSLVITSIKYSELTKHELLNEKLSTGIQDLSVLTSDFLLYQNDRSRIQWLNLHKSFKATILQQKYYLSEKDMAALYNHYLKSHKLFQQIIKIYNNPSEPLSLNSSRFRELALRDQLQTTMRSMSSMTKQFSLIFHEQRSEVIYKVKIIIASLLIVVVLVIILSWLIFSSRIIVPVNIMSKEIQEFSGDMSRRLSIKRNDEFGLLAAEFNNMADKLSETMVSRDKLNHQAHHDALTGLPNRLLFMDRLNQSIKQALRNGSKVAVIFIDLDRFKEINDSLGHNVGDEVLIQISERLHQCMRDTDTVSRLGGDEFMVKMGAIKDGNDIADIVEKIMGKLLLPIPVMKQQLYITLSLGISIYPDDADDAESLIRNADTAMYKSKEEGRNTYRYYTEDMTQKALEHIRIESNLRYALECNELTLHYQPQINTTTMEIIAVEALVRWNHSGLGLIPPDKFIPLAEETGLILPLGEQLLDMACKQITKWVTLYDQAIRVSVNLSVKQLQDPDFVAKISQIMKKNNCRPQWLEMEVTEGYIMTNPQQAITTLQRIRNMGISISIDDFGTGYSSLSYLKKLPIDKLKIDQSFVRDVGANEDDRAIIVAIIALANTMNLKIIAEGVEREEQKDFLQRHGCHYVQGYLYGKPVNSNKMTEIVINGLNYMPV